MIIRRKHGTNSFTPRSLSYQWASRGFADVMTYTSLDCWSWGTGPLPGVVKPGLPRSPSTSGPWLGPVAGSAPGPLAASPSAAGSATAPLLDLASLAQRSSHSETSPLHDCT